jgi:hypothetical protein
MLATRHQGRTHAQGQEPEGQHGPQEAFGGTYGHWVWWWIGLPGLACSDFDRMSKLATSGSSRLDTINPSLTRYSRSEHAPVLPLRDEPDLLSWLESSGRLVADEETASTDVSTVEEEELSALMGEKEDYNKDDEQQEDNWED